MRPFVIYCLTNTVTGQRYVGQTARTMRARWVEHVRNARRGVGNRRLGRAIRRYGVAAFAVRELTRRLTRATAGVAERRLIARMACVWPSGYNLNAGGLTCGLRSTREPATYSNGPTRAVRCAGWRGTCASGWPRRVVLLSKLVKVGGRWRCPSCGSRKRSASPTWRKRTAVAAERRASDPVWLKANAASVLQTTGDPQWLANVRAGAAEGGRKRATDPKWRANVGRAAAKRAKDPVWQRRTKAAGRKRAEDPTWRARNAAHLKRINGKPAKAKRAAPVATKGRRRGTVEP